jgi:multidrug efflux pump subunit AcrA (membrane-fusion protein)
MTSPSHEERAQKGHRPGDDAADGFGALARRLGGHASTSEERLEELLAERRRELEEHAGRFEEVVTDVQRREELVRDARTSVERVLRVGAADLEARESDLAELAQELAVREQRVREEEAGLARRRGELGAVELRRAAVEQREQAYAAREAQISAREAALEERETSAGPQTSGDDDAHAPLLLFVPGASYRLVVIEHPSVNRGDALEVDGEAYRVGRVGSSPLPGDRTRCAYLVRDPRATAPPVESS